VKVVYEEFGSTKAARTVQADVEDWLSESDWAPPWKPSSPTGG